MAEEAKFPEKKRPRKTPLIPSIPSIVSFFNNAPPAKIACPICEQMVSRYSINKHIDEICQKNHDDDVVVADSLQSKSINVGPLDVNLSTNSNLYFKKKNLNQEENATTFESNLSKTKAGVGQQTSPYFKKSNRTRSSVEDEQRVQVVKSISLGSLSSKLSKRHRTKCRKLVPQDERNFLVQDVQGECDESEEWSSGKTDSGDSLQKEKQFAMPGLKKPHTPKESLTRPCEWDKGALDIGLEDSNRVATLKLMSNFDKPATHPESYKKAEVSDDLEAKIQTSRKEIPLSRVQVICNSYRQSFPVERDMEVLSMEGPEDLRNEVVYNTFSESLKEAVSQNLGSGILEKISNGAGSVSDSAEHPYYLRNFMMVLQAVLENEDDQRLFDEQDINTITKFYHLSDGGQKLYVRLFQRKLNWLKMNKIEYAEIGTDLLPIFEELTGAGFLQTESELQDLPEVLDLLSVPELKVLAKTFHLTSSNSQKQQLVEEFLRLAKQRSVFSKNQAGIGAVILKRYYFKQVAENSLLSSAIANEKSVPFSWATVIIHSKSLIRYFYIVAVQLIAEYGTPVYKPHPAHWSTCGLGWRWETGCAGVKLRKSFVLLQEAVEELQILLSQKVYCMDSRGRWWDRLALNLHQHLKHTEKAIECIRKGLLDPFVRTGHQLSLYQRALRMKDSLSCKKFRHLFQELPVVTVEDVTHVTIKGKVCPQTGMGKSVFIMEDLGDEDDDDLASSTVMCSVEDLALAHYRQNGFDQGIHGEGSTFSTLYSLLMWDVIFMDGIPDVFRNSYQAFPLDLYTDSFYENRQDTIEARLQLLHTASSETLQQLIADVWHTQEGKAAALISWDRFTSLQQAQSLLACFGGPFLSGVCRRLCQDLRHCRGGLPDLVVWSTEDYQFKLVEVKGPNDRLSHKQMIWLSELKKLGAVVEVCHVTAIGAKSKCLG
uniref:Fanconi-associated nuclease n=1 Tax=Sphenodon punctatus TaxID=8508 RepID=A0A8D0HK37_SPHPU